MKRYLLGFLVHKGKKVWKNKEVGFRNYRKTSKHINWTCGARISVCLMNIYIDYTHNYGKIMQKWSSSFSCQLLWNGNASQTSGARSRLVSTHYWCKKQDASDHWLNGSNQRQVRRIPPIWMPGCLEQFKNIIATDYGRPLLNPADCIIVWFRPFNDTCWTKLKPPSDCLLACLEFDDQTSKLFARALQHFPAPCLPILCPFEYDVNCISLGEALEDKYVYWENVRGTRAPQKDGWLRVVAGAPIFWQSVKCSYIN